jgi:uncharacterized protein YfcZ (UPF0381/DUF406 family)
MFNRKYALTQEGSTFRKGQRERISEFTLADTRGCSCGQLIDVADGTNDYHFNQFPSLKRQMQSLFPYYTDGARRNGCSISVLRMIQDN